ncbi:PREDICTED: probable protein phosphatase 2C 36 [Camelina sativa]|uniref:Probable protein phosphatase 2C 36 n=1 Tax=Camelina sativa TaxID=90675 RepID=A0ABM0WKW5_CAMSA|nr:PREDICTED: probable protein phosphatase 2C 36 [Camelina sativa]
MGIGVACFSGCCAGTTAGKVNSRYDIGVVNSQENLGHSFCYVPPVLTVSKTSFPPEQPLRPDPIPGTTTTFRSISGASVSANTSTALSASPSTDTSGLASAFESSNRFTSLPLQPLPRGPIKKTVHGSGLFERRFLSGPIESGLVSGKKKDKSGSKSFTKPKPNKKFLTFKNVFTNLVSNNLSRSKKSVIEPINSSDSFDGSSDSDNGAPHEISTIQSSHENPRTEEGGVEEEKTESASEEPRIQWAQGKAGEDRVHVILSEENGWLFVGIYDGFSGPDPPDYLLKNLYAAVLKELKGLLWIDKGESESKNLESYSDNEITVEHDYDSVQESCRVMNGDNVDCGPRNITSDMKKLQWKYEWEHNTKSNNDIKMNKKDLEMINHKGVLKALQQALKKTEESFDLMVDENPELALMGSCVLVTLMKGEDIYVMSVGDSRAVLARRPDHGKKKKMQKELERIKEDSPLETSFTTETGMNLLVPIQLNKEHSTSVVEEVRRIKKEHSDDALAIENNRVKGYLKVTRAFGAAFLKQPKWNEALLEMFRINYVGTSPYITCSPSLHHHRLSSRDKFLILSSDGLYEYFSNEEAIFEVDSFISAFPEGDPAQHLIQEVLLRAAKKYGMDFHELLEIPQGDRRKYHDDVSVIVISLEGRIWRSSM